MIKSEIVERIQAATGFSTHDSSCMFESLLSIIKDTLDDGETIKIAGFGRFEVKEKKDRTGRNPQTGEAITIEARKILSFNLSDVREVISRLQKLVDDMKLTERE